MATLGDATHTVRNGGVVNTPHTLGVIDNTTLIDDGDSPYTVLQTDNVIFCDTASAAITVNLPAGIDGTHYKVINSGTAGYDVTVDPNGTEELYSGGAGVSQDLSDGENIDIHFDSTEGWH